MYSVTGDSGRWIYAKHKPRGRGDDQGNVELVPGKSYF